MSTPKNNIKKMANQLGNLVETIRSKVRSLKKSKKRYTKIDKSASVKLEMRSRKARKLIDRPGMIYVSWSFFLFHLYFHLFTIFSFTKIHPSFFAEIKPRCDCFFLEDSGDGNFTSLINLRREHFLQVHYHFEMTKCPYTYTKENFIQHKLTPKR